MHWEGKQSISSSVSLLLSTSNLSHRDNFPDIPPKHMMFLLTLLFLWKVFLLSLNANLHFSQFSQFYRARGKGTKVIFPSIDGTKPSLK